MINKIPSQFLNSPHRKRMWKESQKIINKLAKTIPIKEAYLRGSFTTSKKRPADVDFIILIKTKSKNKKSKWSVDFVICPDNKYGSEVVKDATNWMKQKYGLKKSMFIRLI
jgi:hypothetical protein